TTSHRCALLRRGVVVGDFLDDDVGDGGLRGLRAFARERLWHALLEVGHLVRQRIALGQRAGVADLVDDLAVTGLEPLVHVGLEAPYLADLGFVGRSRTPRGP